MAAPIIDVACLLFQLAGAFATEEARGGEMYQLNLHKNAFRALSGYSEFQRVDPMRGRVWTVDVLVDPALEPGEVVLRYRRGEGKGKRYVKRAPLSRYGPEV